MRVEPFTAASRELWDEFVRSSRNGTFLFLRDYMEYHAARFEDHSLIFRDDRGAVSALLPANRRGETLESHGGLTFGGVVSTAAMTNRRMQELFAALVDYLRERAFTRFRYRAVPHIYHRAPAEEDLYALHRCGARIVRRATLSVLDAHHPVPVQERRRRGVRKAGSYLLECRETDEIEAYWALLTRTLRETYEARPVHTLDEIAALRRCFPAEIRLFGCFRGPEMVAGVLIYESGAVARAQYIAASEVGKRLAALDLLFEFLLQEAFPAKPYFDLGTSDSADGSDLNHGVLEFKESLGARTVVQDTYELSLSPPAI